MRIENDTGLTYDFVQDDFGGGLHVPGPPDTTYFSAGLAGLATETIPENGLQQFLGCRSDQGLCEPIVGSARFNSTEWSGANSPTVPVAMIHHYVNGSTSKYLIVAKDSTTNAMALYEIFTDGTWTKIGDLDGTAGTVATGIHWRQPVQVGEYLYIGSQETSDQQGTVYRYSPATSPYTFGVVKAGTPPPTLTPAIALVAGGSLTLGVNYRVCYGWDYGAFDAITLIGNLGEAWKEPTTDVGVTTTAGNLTIRISNMDTAPPTGFGHATARLIYATTERNPRTYRLVARQAYTGVALAATYDHTTQDSIVDAISRTRNPADGDGATPNKSPFIVVKGDTMCWHEGRMYYFNHRLSRIYWSRLDRFIPRPDQVPAISFFDFPRAAGRPTHCVSWFGELLCLFENATYIQSIDPGGEQPTVFAVVDEGGGICAKRSVGISPYGVLGVGYEGILLIDRSHQRKIVTDRIRAIYGADSQAMQREAVGGWDQKVSEYVEAHIDATPTPAQCRITAWAPKDDLIREAGEQSASGSTHDLFRTPTCMAVVDGLLWYSSDLVADPKDRLYKRSAGSTGLQSDGTTPIHRMFTTAFRGKVGARQTLIEIVIGFNRAVTFISSASAKLQVFKDGDRAVVLDKFIAAGTYMQLRFVVPMATAQIDFRSLAIRLLLTDTTAAGSRGAVVRYLRGHVAYEPARLVAELVA